MENPTTEMGTYSPVAAYFHDSDCVEYLRADAFVIYERVDEFLTLIYDASGKNVVGFKLKGFKHIFTKRLRSLYRLNEGQFLRLVSVIEVICADLGDSIFENDERARSYKAALELAENDNVELHDKSLKEAA